MEVIPAIDLKTGRCVRLYQGDYEKETVFSDDPVGVALRWQKEGAPRLHVVDLDGAAEGEPVNLEVIAAIVAGVGIPVQVGGGVRSRETAEALLGIGVDRVVLGTAAVKDPQIVEQLCRVLGRDRVVVAVDARDGQVAVQGWTETTGLGPTELVRRMEEMGVARFLYTDIARDGTLTHPNFEAVGKLLSSTARPILVSGGVSSTEHVVRLAAMGAEAAILGRVLYTGGIALGDAIAAGAAGEHEK